MLSKSFDQWGSIVRVIPRRQMLSSNYTPWLVTVTIGQLITQILAEARDRGDWVPGSLTILISISDPAILKYLF